MNRMDELQLLNADEELIKTYVPYADDMEYEDALHVANELDARSAIELEADYWEQDDEEIPA